MLDNQTESPIVSTQVMKEFANVSLRKKLHNTTAELKKHLTKINQTFFIAELSYKTILEAIDLKEKYQYAFYDSLIIATAIENDCFTLYSEDLQHNQIIKKKLKIVNLFKQH